MLKLPVTFENLHVPYQFQYRESGDGSVHYTLKKKILNCLPSILM
jgi:hypothetical protein